MANFIDNVNYYLFQYWIDCQDPRTKNLPFIDKHPIWIILLMTLFYVLVKVTIPNYMKDREPLKIKKTILFYNTLMALGNLYAFIMLLVHINFKDFLNFEYPTDKTLTPLLRYHGILGYLYLLSKLMDLFDTIFFALCKKQSHITLLHLYHHISVPIFGWLTMKINPQIPAAQLFALMNTFIHFVMYSYYFLAALGPTVRKYLWWKRYITQMQLAQFIVLALYVCLILIFQKGYPLFWLIIGAPQPLFFFYMFYDFYKRSYRNVRSKEQHNCILNNNNYHDKIKKSD